MQGPNISTTATRLFGVQLSLLIVCVIFTSLRVYVKSCIARNMAAEDWIIVLATVIFALSIAIAMRGTTFGAFGQAKSGTASTTERIVATFQDLYFCEVLYSPTSLAIRFSICLFLLKIVNHKTHRRIIYLLLAVVSSASISYWLITIFQCVPPSFFWSQHQPGAVGHCLHPEAFFYAGYVHGSVSAVSDLVVGALPIAILWRIRLDRRTKLTALVLLGMSFLNTAIWSIIESAIGIVAASLPTLRPLFRKWPIRPRSDKTPIPKLVLTSRRSRPLELISRWVELTAHNSSDEACADVVLADIEPVSSMVRQCNVTIERGRLPETAPSGGISIHTAIEVKTQPRDSVYDGPGLSPRK
ncbi:hypothetical protein L249_3529 [Ophiocordyceps polyrhachis-furcata BCC 54312]|uniref:Rhodopsin domain-containing protein n=1 Tax=Ophiocordyceps polyrhachis-furcata BCC 54312 TaxID=1330021 RepID=A0A367LN49_9HYPO|nr:hypothetical protein L249_3529 [Ophiocordyceps polyrhachis-furcata BCC 54312]